MLERLQRWVELVRQLVDRRVLGNVNHAVSRRRLAQQRIEVQKARAVPTAHVVHELRAFRVEDADALF